MATLTVVEKFSEEQRSIAQFMPIKKKLAAQKIYVPTLWPNVLDMEGTMEKDYAENILPLPCDQRYTAEDMTRIIDAIERLV